MQKIVILYERGMEIDIRILSGDSLIRHEGIWNWGGTAPLILISELDKMKGYVSSTVRFTQRKMPPVNEYVIVWFGTVSG